MRGVFHTRDGEPELGTSPVQTRVSALGLTKGRRSPCPGLTQEIWEHSTCLASRFGRA